MDEDQQHSDLVSRGPVELREHELDAQSGLRATKNLLAKLRPVFTYQRSGKPLSFLQTCEWAIRLALENVEGLPTEDKTELISLRVKISDEISSETTYG